MVNHQVVSHGDGQGRVNYEIVRAARARGWRVELMVVHCSDDIARDPGVGVTRIDVARVPTQLLRGLVIARRAARWLRKTVRPGDLVHLNGAIALAPSDVNAAHFVHGAWLRSRYYPYRWSGGPYAMYQRAYTTLNAWLERRAFARAQVVVAVSHRVAAELHSIGVEPGRIRVIHNGVDTHQFHPGPGERARWNLPAEVPLFLFAGNIRTSLKNLDGVLRALARLPGVHLAVAGALPGSPFPAMAHALGVADRTYFLGKVDDMPALMRSVDALVFPSRTDTFGLALLEAMSSGLAVITAATAGGAEILGGGGIVLPDPEDVDALTAAMARLASDAALRTQLSMAARDAALAHGWDAMTRDYLGLYEARIAATGTAMSTA